LLIAQAALLASTGPLQVKPLRHPAQTVPRTRSRLLRALLEPHAFAMQATVATPGQGLAQRAQQGSGNLQETLLIARTAVRASTGPLQDKPMSHPARPVSWASTSWEPEDPVKHPARPAERASTDLWQDKLLKHRARSAARASTGVLQDKPLMHRAWPAVQESTVLL
jgi:hypothetical protein